MAQSDLKKRVFALEYMKNGCNAKQAAIAIGYSEKSAAQHGYTLLKDDIVKKELKELGETFSLSNLAQVDKDIITKEIADITEVLQKATRIIRREETEDTIIQSKRKTVDDGDDNSYEIIETRPKLVDVNRAMSLMMNYYTAVSDNGDNNESGVVIMPEVRDNP